MKFQWHKFFKSFTYAFAGIIAVWKSEQNFRFHIIAALCAVIAGIILKVSLESWLWISAAIAFVLIMELFNTALEKLSDFASEGKYSPIIRKVKDISAAAVLLASVFAVFVGIITLILPAFQLLKTLLLVK